MPLGTLDRTPPPFFKQGPSALSKLVLFSALALFLMVADQRLKIAGPLRSAVATVIYPVQWAVLQPIQAALGVGDYFTSLHDAQQSEARAMERLASQADRALQVEQLLEENRRLRELLGMRERMSTGAQGAQVLYDSADPYARRVVVDRGQTHGVVAGSPVIDESGVLGQVTRVYPLMSEVTLLTDRDQGIPVVNVRTGVRDVLYGSSGDTGDHLELRYSLVTADVQVGDLLATSGVDGVYPPGLPVATVTEVERSQQSAFAQIVCTPKAALQGTLHLMILNPVNPGALTDAVPAEGEEASATPDAAKAPDDAPKAPAPAGAPATEGGRP